MELIKSLLANDIVERAVKTFVQTFLATLAVSVVTVDSWETLIAAGTASLAAAISAVWNALKAR